MWVVLLLGACDRPGNGEVVRSAPAEVSSGTATASAGGVEAPPAGGPAGAAAARPTEEPAPPPSGTGSSGQVVLFLGTSLTEGYGLPDPGEAYPARVGDRIRAAGLPFRVVNAGVAGETSAGGLARLDWVLRQEPRVLVVELGANDGLRGLPVEALEENLRRTVRRAREQVPGIEIVLLEMEAPPNLGATYTEAFRETFATVARTEGATLVPFFLEGVAGVPELNQADGIHPTAEGHARMADRVWNVLEPLLRRAVEEAA